MRINVYKSAVAIGLAAVLLAGLRWVPLVESLAADNSLLRGRVTSSGGERLAGVPVRAHRANSNISVSVYSDSHGDYVFPGGSDLSVGSYAVTIDLPDFQPAKREAVALVAGKTFRIDFSLQPREPSVTDATASEIIAALPGTNEQKHLFTQCDNCHSLQRALMKSRTKEDWLQVIRRMAGERAISRESPGTRSFSQKKYLDPLAEYLASIRGPGSSDKIPFQLRPRPTSDASTHIVVTEYDIPRGGSRDLNLFRGDRRFAWPHDIALDPNSQYAYYTDHFTNILGRLDRRTGEVKEIPFTLLPGMGRKIDPSGPAGNADGGAHKLLFDPEGNIVIGMGSGTVRFNPRTEEFSRWPSGCPMFGIDSEGKVWYLDTALNSLDMKTGQVRTFKFPEAAYSNSYDMETNAQGFSMIDLYRLGKIGLFDPKTEQWMSYPTPTPGSGPRRGDLDAQGRHWMGLYWAGRIAVFDPKQPEAIKEYPLIPGNMPYTPPFPAPYSLSVDDRNQMVWTNDFNSGRIYALDMKTGKSTEFLMPDPYEIRDLTVDKTASRPTVWLPAYRPPSRMVKVQVWR